MDTTSNVVAYSKRIIALMIAHGILFIINSYASQQVFYMYSIYTFLPILLMLCIIPLVVSFFLPTRAGRQSAIILLGTLPAEIFYNIITRFISPPFIFDSNAGILWRIIYEVSFGSILVIEVIGFWMSINTIKEIHKQINP